jgi:hypothetical protein
LGATTEEPKAMDWVFSRSQRMASWEKPGSITVDDEISLASVVAWRFHQHQVPLFSKDPFQSSHGWSGWSTICDLMLNRNFIVDSNGSRLFSAGHPLGTLMILECKSWFRSTCRSSCSPLFRSLPRSDDHGRIHQVLHVVIPFKFHA